MAAAVLGWPSWGAADQVVLKTKDGTYEISGDLVGSDGGFLTVRTRMGQVRIPIDQVTCAGPGCPPEMRAEDPAAPQKAPSLTGPGDRTDLTIGIAPALPQDLIGALVAAYGQSGGVTVVAAPDGRSWTITTASGGFQLTMGQAGTADLRIETAEATGGADVRQVIGLEPFIVVTAPRSRPASLSIAALGQIFSGRARDWSQLNFRGGRIFPALPASDPAAEQFLRTVILAARAPADTITRASDIPGFLFSTPGSIALTRGSGGSGLRATPLSGDCGLTARVGAFAVKSGQYPLVRPVVVRAGGGDLAEPVQAFLDFAATVAAQTAVETTGLVGQSIIRAPADWKSDWIASAAKLAEFVGGGSDVREVLPDLIDTTSGADRLSVTLRYAFGSDAPDLAARGDFARLAATIASGAYDGNEIVFIGYTDAGTAITQGRNTSMTAANRVLEDLKAAHPAVLQRPNVKLSTTGFGGIAPLLCSDSAVGRAVNQRVEVWIRPL